MYYWSYLYISLLLEFSLHWHGLQHSWKRILWLASRTQRIRQYCKCPRYKAPGWHPQFHHWLHKIDAFRELQTYCPVSAKHYSPKAFAMATFPRTAIIGTSTIDDPSSVHIWKKVKCTSPMSVKKGGQSIFGNPDFTGPKKFKDSWKVEKLRNRGGSAANNRKNMWPSTAKVQRWSVLVFEIGDVKK